LLNLFDKINFHVWLGSLVDTTQGTTILLQHLLPLNLLPQVLHVSTVCCGASSRIHSWVSRLFTLFSSLQCREMKTPSTWDIRCNSDISSKHPPQVYLTQACPTRRPWYTFLAPKFSLPALTLIRVSRKKYFWITVCSNFFRSTPMNTDFPLFQSRFLFYPFYCPLTPHFFTGESAGISSDPVKQITHLSRLCF
jgi:hypothetical protein